MDDEVNLSVAETFCLAKTASVWGDKATWVLYLRSVVSSNKPLNASSHQGARELLCASVIKYSISYSGSIVIYFYV